MAAAAAEFRWTKQQCREAAADWKRENAPEQLFDDEEAAGPELPACPLCDGSGHVSEARREAYFREEARA